MKKFLIALLVLGSFSIMAKDVCLITIEKDTSSYSVLIGDPENKSYGTDWVAVECTNSEDSTKYYSQVETVEEEISALRLKKAFAIKDLVEKGYTVETDNVLVKLD
jgi:hypothetical protein